MFSSVGSSNLHTGHVLCSFNPGFKQSGWYMCPHGMNMPRLPSDIASQHTVQEGGSISVLPITFLQCLASIFTIGNFWTDSVFARFLRARASASCSLILRTISKKSWSFPPADEAKLLWKLFINWSGEKPWKRVFILRNWWPEKIS